MVAVSDLIDTRASNRHHHAAVLGSVGLKSALVIQVMMQKWAVATFLLGSPFKFVRSDMLFAYQ